MPHSASAGTPIDFLSGPTDGLLALRTQADVDAPARRNSGEAGAALIAASTLTLIASATGTVIGLLRSKLVAVLLGPGGVGILSNIGIYNAFVSTAGTAFAGQGLTRAIAAARAERRDERVDWLIRYSFLVPPAVGLLILMATLVLAAQVSALVMGDTQYAPLIAISAFAIPLTILGASYSGVLQGFVRIGSLAKVSIATTFVSLIATVALIFAFGLTGAVAAASIVALLQLGIFFLREPWVVRGRHWRRRLGLDRLALRPVIQLGLAGVVISIVSTLVTLLIRSDIVRVLGIEQNGIYQPVAAISDTYLEVLIASTSIYLFPRLTELLNVGRRIEASNEVGHGDAHRSGGNGRLAGGVASRVGESGSHAHRTRTTTSARAAPAWPRRVARGSIWRPHVVVYDSSGFTGLRCRRRQDPVHRSWEERRAEHLHRIQAAGRDRFQ